VRNKDLRDLIVASEFHHRLGYIVAPKDTRFDLETPSETKVFFYRLSFLG